MRNNEMEAVLMTIEDYEALHSLVDDEDFRLLSRTIREREATPKTSHRSLDSVLKELDLTRADL